jgi:hypothetical protein
LSDTRVPRDDRSSDADSFPVLDASFPGFGHTPFRRPVAYSERPVSLAGRGVGPGVDLRPVRELTDLTSAADLSGAAHQNDNVDNRLELICRRAFSTSPHSQSSRASRP